MLSESTPNPERDALRDIAHRAYTRSRWGTNAFEAIADAVLAAGYRPQAKPTWKCCECEHPWPTDAGNPTSRYDRCTICGSEDFEQIARVQS